MRLELLLEVYQNHVQGRGFLFVVDHSNTQTSAQVTHLWERANSDVVPVDLLIGQRSPRPDKAWHS